MVKITMMQPGPDGRLLAEYQGTTYGNGTVKIDGKPATIRAWVFEFRGIHKPYRDAIGAALQRHAAIP